MLNKKMARHMWISKQNATHKNNTIEENLQIFTWYKIT